MGYYSKYKLQTFPHLINTHLVAAGLRLDDNGAWTGEDTWYSFDDDLGRVSKEYPEIMFMVTRIGDEPMDIERRWYLNGEVRAFALQKDLDKLFPSFDDAPVVRR